MKNDTLWIAILAAVLLGIMILILERGLSKILVDQNLNNHATSNSNNPQTESAMNKKQYDQQPEMKIDPTKEYQAILRTSKGDITIKLNAAKTPVTVNNFVFLAQEGFYDNTIFHRVIKGFMIQGGDPEGTGGGGPGYRFDDESFEGEYIRGAVAMANAGPNTNGSQFFIIHQDYPLPKKYVIFGNIVNGLDTVDAIATAPVTTNSGGERSKPVTPVTIQSVQITEN